jgi:hypothetical protein
MSRSDIHTDTRKPCSHDIDAVGFKALIHLIPCQARAKRDGLGSVIDIEVVEPREGNLNTRCRAEAFAVRMTARLNLTVYGCALY